jgi:hypothetical protein
VANLDGLFLISDASFGSFGRNAMKSLCVSLALLVIEGCTEPEPAVTGQFGGRMLGLAASAHGAQFQLACGDIATPALRLDASGTMQMSAVANFVGAGSVPAAVELEVERVDADHLTARITYGRFGEWETYTLQRGSPPDFSGTACLASP